jgi:hypothetical protein
MGSPHMGESAIFATCMVLCIGLYFYLGGMFWDLGDSSSLPVLAVWDRGRCATWLSLSHFDGPCYVLGF